MGNSLAQDSQPALTKLWTSLEKAGHALKPVCWDRRTIVLPIPWNTTQQVLALPLHFSANLVSSYPLHRTPNQYGHFVQKNGGLITAWSIGAWSSKILTKAWSVEHAVQAPSSTAKRNGDLIGRWSNGASTTTTGAETSWDLKMPSMHYSRFQAAASFSPFPLRPTSAVIVPIAGVATTTWWSSAWKNRTRRGEKFDRLPALAGQSLIAQKDGHPITPLLLGVLRTTDDLKL